MGDFFERIHNPNSEVDLGYIGSEAARLRAFLYTLRDEDRQREIERLQTDLTYCHLVLSHKGIDFNYGLYEYALHCLTDLKKVLNIEDSEEIKNLLYLAKEMNIPECCCTIADLPDRDKVCEIIWLLDGGKPSSYGFYQAWALFGIQPSSTTEVGETEKQQPQTRRELPEKLSGAKAKNRLKAAQKLGLLDDNYYWIGGEGKPLVLCAFLCACINASCDIHAKAPKEEGGGTRNEWKLYEGFFFRDGKYQGRDVDLSNNFGNLRSKGRKTFNEGLHKKILDFCNVSLSEIIPLKTKK